MFGPRVIVPSASAYPENILAEKDKIVSVSNFTSQVVSQKELPSEARDAPDTQKNICESRHHPDTSAYSTLLLIKSFHTKRPK
jgi:hypothetical protein